MPIFQFQGVGSDGGPRSGVVEAGTRQEALQKLLGDTIQPVSLIISGNERPLPTGPATSLFPRPAPAPLNAAAHGKVHLRGPEVVAFTDELVDYLEAGLQLEAVLQIMESQDRPTPQSRVAALVRERVRDGAEFSEALRQSSDAFGDLYCRVVEAGEHSGTLVPLLKRQGRYLEAVEDLRQRVRMALIYPAFLLGAAALALSVFVFFLVPQMTSLLIRTGAPLPFSTLLLLRVGGGLHDYGLLLFLGIVLGAVILRLQYQRTEGRRWWDEAKLRIPAWGPLIGDAFQARFCQTLANLLQNGVALHEALALFSRSVENLYHRELIQRLSEHLREGLSLTKAMRQVGYFPSSLRDLIIVGEQSGELGPCLEKIGQRYEKLIRARIERMLALVQPLIVVGMGLMVFLIAWSMMSGIFQAMHGLQRHHS